MNTPNREWIKFMRDQYPVGSRIRLTEMNDPYSKLKPGTEGTLMHIDDIGTFHVKWDNGSTLGLVIGEDRFTVLPPQTHELKLYMPLTADLYERDEWGDLENEATEMEGRGLLRYETQITSALLKNQMPEEKERGIMHWYHDKDSVEQKVRSVVFAVEERDRQLWGVAECQITQDLTPEEMSKLKEYISGQASDGWGEGFEQREIQLDRGEELYVHLWSFDPGWSIQTEQERFEPKLAAGLPELCFSVLPDTGDLICIKRGESGYYPSDWSTKSREQNVELANYNNERLGVSAARRRAMEVGSMYGWGAPGADPASYEQKQQMGGMSFG